MLTRYTLFLIILFVSEFCQAQIIESSTMSQTNGYSDVGDMKVTEDGTVYMTGNFSENLNFQGEVANSGNPSYDIFLAKFKNDTALWVNYVGGETPAFDHGACLTIDNDENIIIGGQFGSSGLFGGSINVNHSGGVGTNTDEGIICKYDSSGSILWAQTVAAEYSYIHDIGTDQFNNVYVAGGYSDYGSFGSLPLPVAIGGDGFIGKFDSNGNPLWCITASGSNLAECISLDVDMNGNVYILGRYSDSLSLNGVTLFAANSSSVFTFMAKIDSNGNVGWISTEGGSSSLPHDIKLNESEDKFFLCINSGYGGTYGGVNTAPGGNQPVIAYYDTSGINHWVERFGAVSSASGSINLSVQGDSNVFVASKVGFGPVGGFVVSNNGYSNLMMVKFDTTGTVLWANNIGKANSTSPFLVDLDTTGRIYYSFHLVDSAMCGNNIFYVNGGSEIVFGRVRDGAALIQGSVFQDLNGNQYFNFNDTPLENAIIEISPQGYFASTNAGGVYMAFVDSGNHTVKCHEPLYHEILPDSIVVYLPSITSSSTGVDFYDSIVSAWDMRVFLNSVNPPRPGFDVNYHLSYTNVGTDTTSGTIALKLDSLLSFNFSNPAPSAIVGDSIYWDYSLIFPQEYNSININTTLSASAPLDSLLHNYVRVDPVQGDTVPSDNIWIDEEVIVGSYDPNDKTATPHSELTPQFVQSEEYIYYKVRFQNTGTDTAFTIRVEDSLSPMLDISSFELLTRSHNCFYQITDFGKVMVFFPNIQLVDKNTNELLSNGFFTYRLRIKGDFQIGDTTYNTAGIYFDFNEPIITNTTENYIVIPVSINAENEDDIIVGYPNPLCKTKKFKFIGLNENENYQFSLYTINGRVIKTTRIDSDQVDVQENTSHGIYLYEVKDSNGNIVKSGKLIVQ